MGYPTPQLFEKDVNTMWNIFNLKFDDHCRCCGINLPKGTRAIGQGHGKIICKGCVDCEISPCKSHEEIPFQDEINERRMQNGMMGGR